MVTWENIEAVVERAVFHFGKAAVLVTDDEYFNGMAVRPSIQCGTRELAEAISMLQRLNSKSAGFSLLSDELRKAYLTVKAIEYEEMVEPSDIDPVTFVDAVAAAGVFAECLKPHFERIKREVAR
jgi:hypothetical protein